MIKIGTRTSKLAMQQTEIVEKMIKTKFPEMEIEIVPMMTHGDRVLDRSLVALGGKGVFTRELEEALLSGEIDMAVHSAKDMPMEFAKGLVVGAVLERGNPQDVLVTTSGTPAKKLPAGSVIGTSSLRRELQIRRMNPGVSIKLLRGNVPTRLEKLRAGEYDGILLAAAGLERLGIDWRTGVSGLYFQALHPDEFVPAAGQGIMAVEIRRGEFEEIMEVLHSPKTAMCLKAERNFLTILGGTCNAPCGAYCCETKGGLTMHAMYARDGKTPVYQNYTMKIGEDTPYRLAKKLAAQVRYRTVSLVGAGPGDRGLLTQKGLECIRKADVIVYDNLISPSLLNESRVDAQLIYAGKRAGNHHLSQDQINEILAKKAEEGHYVVRLKGGDPFLFGRGGEEAFYLAQREIPFEIVPGVSSSYSVPAYGGIPVTHRGLASGVHVMTGHTRAENAADQVDPTLVYLMGYHNLSGIVAKLMAEGRDRNTPAAVIQNGTTARQKMAVGTLETIENLCRDQEIGTPAVIVIGSVVSLAENLSWYGKSLLSGRRILLTGTRHMIEQLEEELAPLGVETVALSLIRTRVCDRAKMCRELKKISEYQWLVFTSANGVEQFFSLLKEEETDLRKLMHLKFAVVGEGTMEALKNRGFLCDFIPTVYSTAELARQWIPMLKPDEKVLLARAKEGSPALPEALKQAGISYEDVALYETWEDARRKEELNRIAEDADYVIITSGSGARALAHMMEQPQILDQKLISIGPVTTKAAEGSGLKVYRTAAVYTAEGIVDTILEDNIC